MPVTCAARCHINKQRPAWGLAVAVPAHSSLKPLRQLRDGDSCWASSRRTVYTLIPQTDRHHGSATRSHQYDS